jgi:hypothetical protein
MFWVWRSGEVNHHPRVAAWHYPLICVPQLPNNVVDEEYLGSRLEGYHRMIETAPHLNHKLPIIVEGQDLFSIVYTIPKNGNCRRKGHKRLHNALLSVVYNNLKARVHQVRGARWENDNEFETLFDFAFPWNCEHSLGRCL